MSFADDVNARLVSSGIAASKIGIGPGFQVPQTGEYIVLRETGGTSPVFIHNTTTPAVKRPSLQIIVVASSLDAAMTLALAAYDAVTLKGTSLNGTYYFHIRPNQEPFPLGPVENGRFQVGFNIRAELRPA